MIVRDKTSWIRMVFAIRGSSIKTTWPRIVTVTLFSTIVTLIHVSFDLSDYSLTTTPFSLIGVAMAIFLGFRNNEAYDRFWEGRKLWGRMVNVSRSFTRQSLTLIVPKDEEYGEPVRQLQEKIVRYTVAYVHSFRHHLRGNESMPEVDQYLSAQDCAELSAYSNKPIAILQQIGGMIHQAWRAGHIHDFHVPVLEGSLTEMTGIQGGCERIKGTPIPFTYNVLIHRIVAVYCFALPFGLIESVGMLTPVVVVLISYAFIGLDAIGDDVEQPFEREQNDLPLEAISRTIEIDLLETIGAANVPEPVRPVDGVLY